MKKISFFFHYNKPASKAAGKPIISLHFKQKCHLVNNIRCYVPTFGKINTRQPLFVIKGKSQYIDIRDIDGEKIAVIGD